MGGRVKREGGGIDSRPKGGIEGVCKRTRVASGDIGRLEGDVGNGFVAFGNN